MTLYQFFIYLPNKVKLFFLILNNYKNNILSYLLKLCNKPCIAKYLENNNSNKFNDGNIFLFILSLYI